MTVTDMGEMKKRSQLRIFSSLIEKKQPCVGEMLVNGSPSRCPPRILMLKTGILQISRVLTHVTVLVNPA